MSEYTAYYESFSTGYWACEDNCPCRGTGWASSELDTWHRCPIHFKGQTHPECYDAADDDDFDADDGGVEDLDEAPAEWLDEAPPFTPTTDEYDDIPF